MMVHSGASGTEPIKAVTAPWTRVRTASSAALTPSSAPGSTARSPPKRRSVRGWPGWARRYWSRNGSAPTPRTGCCARLGTNVRHGRRVQQGQGICKACAGNDPRVAEAAFRARLAELGAKLLEPEWLGSKARYHVVCAAGHDSWATPNHVQQRGGVCRECGIAARVEKYNLPRMADAERRFRALLDELEVVLLDPYQGSGRRLRARCPAGHEFQVWPNSGVVHCKTCGRKDQVAAKAKFRERLDGLGVVLMEPGWLGSNKHHRVRCAAGHDYQVRPTDVKEGGGTAGGARCSAAGRDPGRR